MTPRFLRLPARGRLLVSTDLHGNAGDFRALRDVFETERREEPETHWAILGDCVHGPDALARRDEPALYDYPDESWAVVEGIVELRARHPGHVHYVLGNHDYGHVGGAHTRKFHPDEVLHLEASLAPAQLDALRGLFAPALLAVAAPCGVLLAHGSPDDTLRDVGDLDAITLPPRDPYHAAVLRGFLWNYGQTREVTRRLLDVVTRGGTEAYVVIHGHDRDESGYFTEGGNQACPVLFGAPRANKRYVRLDLAARYHHTDDLREGTEVRRLYP